MLELMKLLDFYQRNARLYPALLALLSPVATAIAVLPAGDVAIKAITGIVVGFGSLYLLSDLARIRGRAVQVDLLKTWGGMPTTIFMRHADDHLSKPTKKRYHDFLRSRLGSDAIPSSEEEARDPGAADERYDSCVAWLREQSRGADFDLLLKENATYGFRRNMFGMRVIGLVLCACSLLAPLAVGLATKSPPSEWWAFVVASYAGTKAMMIAAAISALGLLGWIIIVTPTWVRSAADVYAESLLACCDALETAKSA